MKKTKLIPILLAVLLLLTACAPAYNANDFGAFTYPGVNWLIAPEELPKALGVEKDVFTVREQSYPDADSDFYYTVDTVLFGENATVQFVFFPRSTDEKLFLVGVRVSFEKKDEDTYNKICAALNEEFARQNVTVKTEDSLKQIREDDSGERVFEPISGDTDGVIGYSSRCSFSSTAKLGDLPEDIRAKADEAASKAGLNTNSHRLDLEEPLSYATVKYREMADGEDVLQLEFTASAYGRKMIWVS